MEKTENQNMNCELVAFTTPSVPSILEDEYSSGCLNIGMCLFHTETFRGPQVIKMVSEPWCCGERMSSAQDPSVHIKDHWSADEGMGIIICTVHKKAVGNKNSR
ncbi:uncharacterized protein WM277_007221 isoform 2-T3 [Molossus nigricans]